MLENCASKCRDLSWKRHLAGKADWRRENKEL